MSPLISVAEGLVLLSISVEVAGVFHAYLDAYSLRKKSRSEGKRDQKNPTERLASQRERNI